jgi:MFS family permease
MRLRAYCWAGLIYDWLAFVFQAAVVIRAEELGASATELALLLAPYTVAYVLNSLFSGRLADRLSKSALARWGCVIAVAGCAIAALAPNVGLLFAATGVMGVAGSVYWPAVQGALGAETEPARMEQALGAFNVMWCIGKSLGFALAGWMSARLGHTWTLAAAGAAAVPILFFFPRDAARKAETAHEAGHPDRAAFRTMGYVANFFAFGVGATFGNQFIKYLSDDLHPALAETKTFFGLFLGTIFAAQAAAFFALQRSRAWTYRRAPLYLTQAVSAAAAFLVTATRNDAVVLAVAPFVGAGTGFAYASSIYYSLHGPADHGKYAGIHEAVLAAGAFLVPILGGHLADRTMNLRMPYWVAAGAALAGILVQEVVYRRRSRS